MQLNFLSVNRKAIHFGITLNANNENDAAEERRVVAHEAPLPELTNAFAELGKVMCDICEWPADYVSGLSVFRLTISYTKHGTRSVKFKATKQLNCRREFLHKLDSPMVQIDKPADGESGEIQLDAKSVALVAIAIKEAERYAKGERSQTLLNFDEAKAALQATADLGQDMFAQG
ncbi:MAG: hypothetical protein QM680_13525 [Luteolibacter sp.]